MNVIANPLMVTPKTEVGFLYCPLMTIYIYLVLYACVLWMGNLNAVTSAVWILTEFCYFRPSSHPYSIVHNKNISKIKCIRKIGPMWSLCRFMYVMVIILCHRDRNKVYCNFWRNIILNTLALAEKKAIYKLEKCKERWSTEQDFSSWQ